VQGLIRSGFFWRLLATGSALVLLTALAIGWLVERQAAHSVAERQWDELEDACALLVQFAQQALERGDATVQADARRIGAATGLRVTVVRSGGEVLADSALEDPELMENHGQRPEIVAALSAPTGRAQRTSRTVGYEARFVARALQRDGRPLGFVRVSLPVEHGGLAARTPLLVGAGVGLVLALLCAVHLARRTTTPIQEMTRVAEELRAGRYEGRAVTAPGEVGLLADTLDRLGAEVTERIARISAEDAQLRAMFAGMVEGVIAVDEEDRIRFCNQAARRMLVLPQVKLDGQKLWELVRVAGLQELLDEERKKGALSHAELGIGPEGRRRVLAAHAGAFEGGGRSGLVIVLHDITEVRRLEQIRRDFVANVSHELKTPLTSIKGFVETLLSGALHETQKAEQFLRRIDVNVERLHYLVSDLLSLARIESQGAEVALAPVDWRVVLRDVLRRHKHAAELKGLALSADEHSLVVMGDTEAMTQVLDNLVDNALQYTPAPGRVHVRLEARDGVGCLSVEDTGVGIPKEDLERVFERFYRVDKARSRAVGGTGLGLSIVKHLVLAMHGQVTVESELGRGSRFKVQIPLA
jgi:two-component system phosphate regulon sensor histidine kinase PhoR